MGFEFKGLGFGVWILGFWVWCLGFGVWGVGFGVWGFGFYRHIRARIQKHTDQHQVPSMRDYMQRRLSIIARQSLHVVLVRV